MLAVIVLILCSAVIACVAFVDRSFNVVALKGTRVELPCNATKVSDKFHWSFAEVGRPTSAVTIYSPEIGISPQLVRRMMVNATIKPSNLVINSVQLQDAGTYVCKVIWTNSVLKETGELLVLDGEPDCGTNLSSLYNSVTEGEFFQLYCNISFRSNWSPRMDCSQDGNNRRQLNEESSLSHTAGRQQSITHTVTYSANRSMHNTVYSCRIFFSEEHRVSGFTFSNVHVSYQIKSWISPRINITYAPTVLLISPQKQTYNPGEKLICSSEANPTPLFAWKELSTGRSVPGNVFPIKEYMTQEPISILECTSWNSVGMTLKRISFSVEKASSEPSSSSLTSITLTITGILSLFFMAMLAMLIVYHVHIKRIVAGRKRASNENSVEQLPSVEKYEEIQTDEGQLNSDDITAESRRPTNDLADDDINETYTTILETT